MRSIKEYLDKSVIQLTDGQTLGNSKTCLINNEKKSIAAIIMLEDERWYTGVNIFAFEDIVSAGSAIILEQSNLYTRENKGKYKDIIDLDIRGLETNVYTQFGKRIGRVGDIFIDDNGNILQCVVYAGAGKVTIDAANIITFFKDIIIIKDELDKNKEIIKQESKKIEIENKTVSVNKNFTDVIDKKMVESNTEIKKEKQESRIFEIENMTSNNIEVKLVTEKEISDVDKPQKNEPARGIIDGFNFGIAANDIITSQGVTLAEKGKPITREMIKSAKMFTKLRELFIPNDSEVEITNEIREKISHAQSIATPSLEDYEP